MDDIKKFLEAVKDQPDTVEITIGEAKVPLGSLRALNSTERAELAERMKQVEAKETEVKSRGEKVVELARKAQAAYDAAEEARRSAATAPARTGEDPFDDPWLKPVKSELSKRDEELKTIKAQLAQALSAVKDLGTIGLEDRWDREYSSLDFGKRDKKPSRQELLDMATKENLIDRHKIPSIRLAWEKMSAADRLSDEKEKARLEGIEEGRRQAMAARVPPPGVSGPGAGALPPGAKGPKDDLGDLYGEAIKDPELRALLEQAQSNGVM